MWSAQHHTRGATLSYSQHFRTSWFLSHAYAATSAALHSASPFLFGFSGRVFYGLRAWLSLVFVQLLRCHGCKQSRRVINHCRIEPHLFPTEATRRSPHAGSGREPIRPPSHLPLCRLQHPTLTLTLWSSSTCDSTSIPVAEARSPRRLAKCVCGGSPPFPFNVPRGGAGAENVSAAARGQLRPRAAFQLYRTRWLLPS